jgi:hypothetical protein
MFVVHAALLLFGVYRRHTAYRIAMALAIPAFGTLGVVGNIWNYLQTGLEGYSSFAAWSIGTPSLAIARVARNRSTSTPTAANATSSAGS